MEILGEVSTFTDFLNLTLGLRGDLVGYRGESEQRTLTPSAGRITQWNSQTTSREQEVLRMFKRRAYAFERFNSNWEWLFLGQHHGLPTRLLDWSEKPLVAAFFAVERENKTTDSIVYAIENRKYLDFEEAQNSDPFSIKTIKRVVPLSISPRISAQSGFFTIHPNPSEDYRDNDELKAIIIKAECKPQFKWILHRMGVHRESLFPDLDGLASHMKYWKTDGLPHHSATHYR